MRTLTISLRDSRDRTVDLPAGYTLVTRTAGGDVEVSSTRQRRGEYRADVDIPDTERLTVLLTNGDEGFGGSAEGPGLNFSAVLS